MKIGYARVSTARQGQFLDTQHEALLAVGCDPDHLYSDSISGAKWRRPGRTEELDYMRTGDTLVVSRLDRLGRNFHETVTTIAGPRRARHQRAGA